RPLPAGVQPPFRAGHHPRFAMQEQTVRHYDAQYGQFASQLYGEIRSEAFGEDIGQNGWTTADEQDLFIEWLQVGRDSRLLDVACGSGGTTLRIARLMGCGVVGIDIHAQAVATARAAAERIGLGSQASFEEADGAKRLPFE